MDGTRHITGALLLLALVSASAAAQPAASSPSEVLMNVNRFDGQPVRVRGSITNLHEQTSIIGRHSYTFDVGDGQQSIRVFASGRPPCQAGPVLVDGRFEKQKAQQFILTAKVTCRSQD